MMLTNITSKVQQSTFFPIMPRQPRGRLCYPHNLPKLLRIFHTITLSPQSPCRESPPPPYPPPLPPFCPKAFRMPSLVETPPPGEWSSEYVLFARTRFNTFDIARSLQQGFLDCSGNNYNRLERKFTMETKA